MAAETKLACLEVFALGGPSSSDDGTESGYFAVRTALAKSIADATSHHNGDTPLYCALILPIIGALNKRGG
jgi:hypothetical protein